MDPSEFVSFESAYAGKTLLHPIVAIFLIAAAIAIFSSKRQYVIIPLLLAQNFITSAQRIYIAGMNFPVMRLLFFLALIRVFLRNEHACFSPNRLDILVILYSFVTPVFYTMNDFKFGSLVYACGNYLFDCFLSYITIRMLIRNSDDIDVIIKTFVYISFFVASLFIIEYVTRRNIMSIFGGVPDTPNVRDGRMRLQGAYPHPILAGSYWASIIPFLLAYGGQNPNKRPINVITVGFALVIVYLCASSTPIISAFFCLAAAALYFRRSLLKKVIVVAVIAMLLLALTWKHPIWYLFTKIDIAGGSTGYFRYLLVDAFIKNWKDWILFGVRDTLYWGMNLDLNYAGLRDLCNQFVSEGVSGGVFGLVMFIAIIATAFRFLGGLIKDDKDATCNSFLYWSIGVSISSCILNFLGVSYFGSVLSSWWMLLALCGSLEQRRQDETTGDELASTARYIENLSASNGTV